MNEFSFFKAPINRSMTPAATWGPRDAYEYIVGESAKVRTETLRTIDDAAQRRAYKSKSLDFVTFGGMFSYRSNAGLIEASGLMCMDIDDLPGEEAVWATKKTLLADPFFPTWLLFTSPGGFGCKWIIKVLNMMGFTYSEYYKAVANYLLHLGIVADHTSDIVRACYLPWDPDCFYCEDGDDGRERETFNPAAWTQQLQMPTLTLSGAKKKTKISKKTDIMKNEGTDAETEAHSTAGMSFSFSNIDTTPRARTYYRLYLRGELEEKVEELVSKLEELDIDIAPTYNEWVTLGFRLVEGLGKEGQDAFVRLSKLHKKPQMIDPAKKYQELLAEGAQRTRIDYFIEEAERIIEAAQPEEENESEDDDLLYL